MPENGGSDRRRIFVSTLPRQHGAWSVLISCFILGAAVGGSIGTDGVVLLISLVFSYFARHAWNVYQRARRDIKRRKGILTISTVYSLIVICTGGYLVLIRELWGLVGIGATALFLGAVTLLLGQRGYEFTAGGEIVGILGLVLAAPAAEYVVKGVLSEQTVGLFLVCAFFFCGSVFHVRYLVRSKKASRGPLIERLRSGGLSVIYHVLALSILAYLSYIPGALPPLVPLALVPVTMKALYVVGHRYETPLPVRQIGYREVAHTIIFVILAGLAFHMG